MPYSVPIHLELPAQCGGDAHPVVEVAGVNLVEALPLRRVTVRGSADAPTELWLTISPRDGLVLDGEAKLRFEGVELPFEVAAALLGDGVDVMAKRYSAPPDDALAVLNFLEWFKRTYVPNFLAHPVAGTDDPNLVREDGE